ncbi:hypothetical protein BDK92_4991 [Micromonospora pisi]|uniref:Uncharacterized protein n=2 Tax=Micromonospora pisi TaxID=589240 RepID=A0A495JNU0_9ACTN|nr:hypothetical protein BDK92_4991 [Micromonospora pisi]
MLGGSLIALLGYLVPWFKQSGSYDWSYSGWGYASLSNGGGWTLVTFAWLLLAFVASLWAGRSLAAAMTGVVGAVGAAFFALAVVAASFASIPEQTNTNYITEFPVNIGLPLLAGGLGLLFAGGCRAVAVSVVRVGRQSARPQPGDAV